MQLKGWQIGVAVGCLVGFFALICALGAFGFWFYMQMGEENAELPLRGTVQEQSNDLLTPEDAPQNSPALNRIAVLGSDSNIFTVAADGSDKQVITEDANDTLSYRYPTWSPDSRTLAYVELGQRSDSSDFESALHLAPAAGGDSRRIETEFAPFYLYWSPTGEQLAFLSNWENSMALRTVTLADESNEAKTIRTGMPFFFSWEPSGESLFAHIGSDLLLFLDVNGEETNFSPDAGMFQSPHWSKDGEHLVYVRDGEGRGTSALTVSDGDGTNERTLREEVGVFSFNWSSDSRRVAYSFTDEMVGLPAFGALYVEDIETGERVTVSEEAVISFFWSPDGTKLAYLVPEEHAPVQRAPEAAPLRQEGDFWLRWYVWDGTTNSKLTLFSPTQDFLYDYIRYFDQYAQSVSLWSPDSQTLLYSGLSESGLTGIWTLPIAEGSTPKRIAIGVLATWSPQ